MTPKSLATQPKINKWDCIQTKKLLQSKGNNQQNEIVCLLAQDKIFANHISDKGLISKT
jgi:hypothetical protein